METSNTNNVPPFFEGDVSGEYQVIQDERVVNMVISACARGPRQEQFLKDAFAPKGAAPVNYTGLNWMPSWRKSLSRLIERVVQFLGRNSSLGLVIYFTPGPRGGWWTGRFYIRGVPLPTEEKEVP